MSTANEEEPSVCGPDEFIELDPGCSLSSLARYEGGGASQLNSQRPHRLHSVNRTLLECSIVSYH